MKLPTKAAPDDASSRAVTMPADLARRVERLIERIDRRIEEFLPRELGPADIARYVGGPWLHGANGQLTAGL